jgi:hypothetical protein
MFSARKILKPDVPPKRHTFKLQFLRAWLKLPFFPARHFLSVRNAISEKGPTAERKIFRRDGT